MLKQKQLHSEKVQVWTTKREKVLWNLQAELEGLTLSAFVRERMNRTIDIERLAEVSQ